MEDFVLYSSTEADKYLLYDGIPDNLDKMSLYRAFQTYGQDLVNWFGQDMVDWDNYDRSFTLGQILSLLVKLITVFELYDETNPEVLDLCGPFWLVFGTRYMFYQDLVRHVRRVTTLHISLPSLSEAVTIRATWLETTDLFVTYRPSRRPPTPIELILNRTLLPGSNGSGIRYMVSPPLFKLLKECVFDKEILKKRVFDADFILNNVLGYLRRISPCVDDKDPFLFHVKGTLFEPIANASVVHQEQIYSVISFHCDPVEGQ